MVAPALSHSCAKCNKKTLVAIIRAKICRNCGSDIPDEILKQAEDSNVRSSSTEPNTLSGPDDAECGDAGGTAYQALAEQLRFFKDRVANREA